MQLRNDQLAERILEAAKSEFLEKGYRQASVRSIAASVGVTTGALYRYYANTVSYTHLDVYKRQVYLRYQTPRHGACEKNT